MYLATVDGCKSLIKYSKMKISMNIYLSVTQYNSVKYSYYSSSQLAKLAVNS